MAPFLELDWRRSISLVAGVALLALSLLVFALRPGNRLARAFSLYLFFNAFFVGLFAFNPTISTPGERLRAYFRIGLPFATIYFGSVFWLHYHGGPHQPRSRLVALVPILSLAALLACEVWYFLDHSTAAVIFDPGPPVRITVGWMDFLGPVANPLAFLAAFLLAIEHRSAPPELRNAWFLGILGLSAVPMFLGISFTLNFLLLAVFDQATLAIIAAHPPILIGELAFLVSGALTFLLALYLWRGSSSNAALRGFAKRFLSALGAVGALAVATRIVFWFRPIERWDQPHLFVYGLVQLVGALLLVSPVLKGQIFDVDQRIRLTIKRGTFATLLVAIVFVVAEVAANWLSDSASFGLGGVFAAGVLLFAIHPLQRFADRIARGTVPQGRPFGELSGRERLDLYREQAVLAWMDGTMQRKERMLLDQLRERLDISFRDAARIERDVVGQNPV